MTETDTIEIDTMKLCEQVAELCNEKGNDIVTEQVRRALSGISNLYYSLCLNRELPSIDIMTNNTFVSEEIGMGEILQQMENSTGEDKDICSLILEQINEVLSSILAEYPNRFNSKIEFYPVGIFELKDFEKMLFQLRYEDPNAIHYDKFLCKYKKQLK